MIDATLLVVFFVVAALHSSVGLAGGSSYTAFMAIFGLPLTQIPAISLSLNALVSSIGSINFYRFRHFNWRLWLPIQLTALPAVYVGAQVMLPARVFYAVLLVTLLVSMWRLWLLLPQSFLASCSSHRPRPFKPSLSKHQSAIALQVKRSRLNRSTPQFTLERTLICSANIWQTFGFKVLLGAVLGATLGFLSGSIGIGGGIYLVPSLVLLKLAEPKQASAVGVVFILVNSSIGLFSKWQVGQLGALSTTWLLPALLTVAVGGMLGSYLGASRLPSRYLMMLLLVVMGLASLMLIFKLLQ